MAASTPPVTEALHRTTVLSSATGQSIVDIFENSSYGPAPEADNVAQVSSN